MPELFLDTETTDLPDYALRSDHPDQPHIVQLALVLSESVNELIQVENIFVRPDGWQSTPAALARHGITHEQLMDEGIPEADALELYLALAARGDVVIAHNLRFDRRVIRIGLCRYRGRSVADAHDNELPGFCTMQAARGICGLPHRWNGQEAVHERLFGKPVKGAHDALIDAFVCRRIYYELQRLSALSVFQLEN